MRSIIRAGLAVTVTMGLSVVALPGWADPDLSKPSQKSTAVPRALGEIIPARAQAQMAALRPAKAASDRIQATIEARRVTGLSAIMVDANGVDVYWKGELPADLLAQLTQAVGSVPLRVRPARYSRSELVAAHNTMVRAIVADPTGLVNAVGIKPDGTALNVYVRAGALVDPSALPAVGVAVSAVPLAGRASARADGSLARGQTATASPCANRYYCRAGDIAPYWGGARISTPISDNCTSGWAAHSTVDDRRYLLTAGHCANSGPEWGDIGDTVWTDPARLHEVGKVRYKVTSHDVELIEAPGGPGIYTGGFTDDVANPVGGWERVRPNLPVCVSGAMTAAVLCDYTVLDLDVSGVFDGELYESLVLAKSPSDQPCTRTGDSGAPVFTLDGGVVWADGTLTGVQEPDCHYMYFQDFATAAADFQITADSIFQ
ncbi:hypothetical protein FKR81_00070 [Lentzea tibetensis]|uniref:Uncharacterized protein n=1 Tax=Lentzea tibetensis TaxID=2591470 RepID=A0A563F263_9PSEU|nr:hypothetical protein [Lentzea tibetensis]TWP54009.1 hypothetical protein FKR81_00070 [Lentzea tibetensis]